MTQYVVVIEGRRKYQVTVRARDESDARAQVEQMVVTGSLDFSHDLIGFKWEISNVEEAI